MGSKLFESLGFFLSDKQLFLFLLRFCQIFFWGTEIEIKKEEKRFRRLQCLPDPSPRATAELGISLAVLTHSSPHTCRTCC